MKIREHITPYLKQLHWLPVRSRLQYKLLLLVHKALNGLAPPYIKELLKLYVPARNLRSSSGNLLKLPSTKTVTYGERQFSYGATELWNNLPSSFRTMNSLPLFKKTLKTYFFVKAFYIVIVISLCFYALCISPSFLFYNILMFYLSITCVKRPRATHCVEYGTV